LYRLAYWPAGKPLCWLASAPDTHHPVHIATDLEIAMPLRA
jgi:hypothetical protein